MEVATGRKENLRHLILHSLARRRRPNVMNNDASYNPDSDPSLTPTQWTPMEQP
jgi:hypothetical protein